MHLLKFDSERAWREAAASFWRDRLRLQPQQRLCLAAGNTPRGVYAEMVRSAQAGWVSFQQAEVFLLDEYGELAFEDSGTCLQQLRTSLIDHIDLPPGRFHFPNPHEPDLARMCRDYDAAIGAGGGFDLAVLGIGLNGHLGMNEPGSAADSTTRRIELHPGSVRAAAGYLTHDQLPRWGVTVGLKWLLEAREVWLLATGTAKADIVRQIVQEPATESVPASLLKAHANCWLMVDAAAGALV